MRKPMMAMTMGLIGCGFIASALADGPATRTPGASQVVGGSDLTFHVASLKPNQDYDKMRSSNSGAVYVSPDIIFGGEDVISAEPIRSKDGTGLALRLTDDAYDSFNGSTRNRVDNRLAIIYDGTLIAAPKIETSRDGTLRLSGVSPSDAKRISRLWVQVDPIPLGATLTVVTRSTNIGPGESVTADVYLSGTEELKLYQVRVDAVGGTSGQLERVDMVIDKSRDDYVFSAMQVVDAVDTEGGRMGAVLFNGSAQVTDAAYLGSFTFVASPDASGTFKVRISVGPDSFLNNGADTPIPYVAGADAIVSIGDDVQLRDLDR